MQPPCLSEADTYVSPLSKSPKIAVLIPCRDEAAAIGTVVQDSTARFRWPISMFTISMFTITTRATALS